jgi:hypothetical protein
MAQLTADTPADLIAQADLFHWPVPQGARAGWHKEWYHFCILGESIHVIVNLSLSGDTRPAAPSGAQLARVLVMTRSVARDIAWDGDVETLPWRDVCIASNAIDARFGHNTVRFQDGSFDLSVALQDRPIALKLSLRPLALPLVMRSNACIGEGSLNWLVAPRLAASGAVTVGRSVHVLKDAPAYHDHNWGRWLWGQDFAWQWGFGLQADAPWSAVFYRTTNRARSRVRDLSLALWKGERLQCVFAGREVQVHQSGYLSRPRVDKYPRVMALVSPETTTDVPRHLDVIASTGGDELRCHFLAEDVAQVVIPNETDLDSTLVNEAVGRVTLEGRVEGETVSMEGKGSFEFLNA